MKWISLLFLLLFCACATTNNKDSLSKLSKGHVYASTNLAYKLVPILWKSSKVFVLDDNYVGFTKAEWKLWLEPITRGFIAESWDCDDMAMECMVKTKLKYKTSGRYQMTPAIGFVVGDLRKRFLGMSAGGLHAINIVYTTDSGWCYFDPQSLEMMPADQNSEETRFIPSMILF